MTDEPVAAGRETTDGWQEPPEHEENKSRRDILGPAGIVVLVLIVIFVILLLRDCGAGADSGGGRGGAKTIERVEGMEPVAGAISVWISSDTSIDRAVAGAGVNAGEMTSLGQGRYLVEVEEGSEATAIRSLKAQSGVHDAGRVYDEASRN